LRRRYWQELECRAQNGTQPKTVWRL
jgi:hypothetical protein